MKDSFINSLIVITLSALLVVSPIVYAEDNIEIENAVPIQKGDTAPFTGTLLSNEAAASILSELRVCNDIVNSDLKLTFDKYKATCDLEKQLLTIQVDTQQSRYENIINAQTQQLDYMLRANTSPKLSKEAVFILGVISGVGITMAAAYGLSAASSVN